jgi:hypothetical protein
MVPFVISNMENGGDIPTTFNNACTHAKVKSCEVPSVLITLQPHDKKPQTPNIINTVNPAGHRSALVTVFSEVLVII